MLDSSSGSKFLKLYSGMAVRCHFSFRLPSHLMASKVLHQSLMAMSIFAMIIYLPRLLVLNVDHALR